MWSLQEGRSPGAGLVTTGLRVPLMWKIYYESRDQKMEDHLEEQCFQDSSKIRTPNPEHVQTTHQISKRWNHKRIQTRRYFPPLNKKHPITTCVEDEPNFPGVSSRNLETVERMAGSISFTWCSHVFPTSGDWSPFGSCVGWGHKVWWGTHPVGQCELW